MTSNIGAQQLQAKGIGWDNKKSQSDITEHFITAAEKYFRPELFNRIDRIVPFAPLDAKTVRFILDREIALLQKREGLSHRSLEIEISDPAKDWLTEKGYDEKYGARQLQRTIRENLVTPLARKVNEFPWDEQITIKINVADNQLVTEIENDELAFEILLENLEKINNADFAGELRYSLDAFIDSFTWLEFTDLLLRTKEEEKAAAEKGEALSGQKISELLVLRSTEKRVQELQAEIEKLEMEISLVCLDLHTYSPKITDEMSAWQAKFSQVKVDLLASLNPEANRTTLSIYGSGNDIPTIFAEYQEVFEAFGVEFSANLVWFRADYFNETIEDTTDGTRKPREAYIYTDFRNKFDQPQKAGDLLRGIEISLKSPLVHWLFRSETGLQHRIFDKEIEPYMILVESEVDRETPTNIHRRDFYKGTPRRVITVNSFKDTMYKVEKETKDIADLLEDILAQHFSGAVEENL